MIPIFSCYPCAPSGTILLQAKAICSKRMRRLISISVNYMLCERYISNTINRYNGANLLRWLRIVSSTFQGLDFDV